jgi:hypothetical protein
MAMKEFAIIFSVENRKQEEQDFKSNMSLYEKMAIGLSDSIRQHMPDVDVYCGNFTDQTLSNEFKNYLTRYNVKLCEDLIFSNLKPATYNLFLRSFTKDYFAKKLLNQYRYLIYTDVDVIALRPFEFSFNPTDPIAVVNTIPDWVKAHLILFTKLPLDKPLLYLWLDIINTHNAYIFDIDYRDEKVLYDHNLDVIISNRILESNLDIIEQDFGGYHCFKPPKITDLAYHYDGLTSEGSLYMIEDTHPGIYKKYVFFFEKVLHAVIENEPGKWETIKAEFNGTK